jgi:hypothetical protein
MEASGERCCCYMDRNLTLCWDPHKACKLDSSIVECLHRTTPPVTPQHVPLGLHVGSLAVSCLSPPSLCALSSSTPLAEHGQLELLTTLLPCCRHPCCCLAAATLVAALLPPPLLLPCCRHPCCCLAAATLVAALLPPPLLLPPPRLQHTPGGAPPQLATPQGARPRQPLQPAPGAPLGRCGPQQRL